MKTETSQWKNETSDLGQKRTCAPQNSMSALIATTKADIRNGKS
jgi:hypothetical protein